MKIFTLRFPLRHPVAEAIRYLANRIAKAIRCRSRVIPFGGDGATLFALAILFACFLVACGVDSSSKVIPDPFGNRLSSSSSSEEVNQSSSSVVVSSSMTSSETVESSSCSYDRTIDLDGTLWACWRV